MSRKFRLTYDSWTSTVKQEGENLQVAFWRAEGSSLFSENSDKKLVQSLLTINLRGREIQGVKAVYNSHLVVIKVPAKNF